MNTHVSTSSHVSAHTADDMALRELAAFANKNSAEFGGKVKEQLKVFGKSVESLAQTFRENRVSPNDSATLNMWLGGQAKPDWRSGHMDAILDHLDLGTEAFMGEFNLPMPACHKAPAPAPAAVAPAPARDPNLERLLLKARESPFVFGGCALRRMAEQQTNLVGLANAFARAGLQPSDPRQLHAWLKGAASIQEWTAAHLNVLLAYLCMSAAEMLEVIPHPRQPMPEASPPAPSAPAAATQASAPVAAAAKTPRVKKEPQAGQGEVTPSALAEAANADRKAFGAMAKAMRVHAGFTEAAIHRALYEKGLVAKSLANITHLLGGNSKWFLNGQNRAAALAALFNLDEAQMLEAFHAYRKDPESFDPGLFVKKGTPIEAQRKRAMAKTWQARHVKPAAKAPQAAAPAPEPAREPPAETVVEATAEPEPQAPAATPPATGTHVAAVKNHPDGIILPDMEKPPSDTFRAQELAMLQLTQEQFADMSEPERAKTLLQRVQQTPIRPELLSLVLFRLLSLHAAELEGPSRVKFLHALMGDALAEG